MYPILLKLNRIYLATVSGSHAAESLITIVTHLSAASFWSTITPTNSVLLVDLSILPVC